MTALAATSGADRNWEVARPLLLQGAPYERGLAQGETLRDQIQEVVGRWKAEVARMYQMDADEAIARFVAGTDFVPAIQRWTPDLLDEVRGIAVGADVAWETILGFQLLDEMWSNEDVILGEHCSSLGVAAQGLEPAFVAQNVDVESFRDGFQILLHIKHADSDLESFVLSTAGLIGFNGMNNHSIGICCNALVPLRGCRDGLPVAGVVWHTNHPMANGDYNAWYRAENNPFLQNSTARYQSMEQRLVHPSQGARLDQIKEILTAKDPAEHPICGSKGEDEFYTQVGMFTFASTIVVLGDELALHVSFGPPDTVPYRRFEFGKPAVS